MPTSGALPAKRSARLDNDAEALLQRAIDECEDMSTRLKDLLRLTDALIAVVPAERRPHYAESIAKYRMVSRPRRIEALNDNIVSIVREKQRATVADVRDTLTDQGVPTDQKQVTNALDYLVRRGQLVRIAPGVYQHDRAATDRAIEQILTDAYGPPTYRGHPPSDRMPEDY